MTMPIRDRPLLKRLAASFLLVALFPWTAGYAGRSIAERRSVDPRGSIEVVAVDGAVEISGWDRAEVDVSGTIDDQVERVEVTTRGAQTTIHVLNRTSSVWHSSTGAHLLVRVPAKSELSVSLVSADLKITGVAAAVKLRTVSGEISGDVRGDLRADTVSGGVRISARAAKNIEINTVSGGVKLDVATLNRARLESVSGDLSVRLSLAPEGQLEAESVSGSVSLDFRDVAGAEFDAQTLSGDIDNCFGPKPAESRHGPGSRLEFKSGDGRGRVRVQSKSGDISLCNRKLESQRIAPRSEMLLL